MYISSSMYDELTGVAVVAISDKNEAANVLATCPSNDVMVNNVKPTTSL